MDTNMIETTVSNSENNDRKPHATMPDLKKELKDLQRNAHKTKKTVRGAGKRLDELKGRYAENQGGEQAGGSTGEQKPGKKGEK
ncbi:Uu.00g124940.m01.CDS01 [Anthostomella pinea]|uniref:Uu.00g124940.m01.CDS01 n=1 Tax=Anthostomella pinea TaxID=933095 RepID=A0AAI8YHJ3_9PEZI|nr:Uu.00g124940.m01.CDS01 [Anthostomella pinea]